MKKNASICWRFGDQAPPQAIVMPVLAMAVRSFARGRRDREGAYCETILEMKMETDAIVVMGDRSWRMKPTARV